MEQNQLIEKIVADVVARMQSGTLTRPAGAAQAGAQAAAFPALGPADIAKFIDHTMLRPEATVTGAEGTGSY